MITTTQITQFREEGYFILSDLFTSEEIDALVAHIDPFVVAHQAELEKKGKDGISRANEIAFTIHLAEKDPAIRAFVSQERFAEPASALLNAKEISLFWDQAVYKQPETEREFPWHQDNGYVDIEPLEYVTCWLALNDVSIENGCIWALPESHHQGKIEHKPTPIGHQCYFGDEKGVPVPLKKGSMVVFSSLLFHRSGPNLSDAVRKGYVIQYTSTDVKDGNTGELLNRMRIA